MNTKIDNRKSLFMTSKSKIGKSRTKTKHFKLFKKRNLNSKMSKDLKFSEISRASPTKSKMILRKKNLKEIIM